MQSIETLAADTLVQLQHHHDSKSCDGSDPQHVKNSPQQNKRKATTKSSKPKKTNISSVDTVDMSSLGGTDTSNCSLHSAQIFKSEGEFLDTNIKISPKLSKDIDLARVVNKMCHLINTSHLDELTALFDSAAPNCPINVGVVPFKQKHNLRDYFKNLANTHPDVLMVPDNISFIESNVITATIGFSGTRTHVVSLDYMQKCLGNRSLVDCMDLSYRSDEEISVLRKREEDLYQGAGAKKSAYGELTLFLAPDVNDDDELVSDAQQDYLETCSNVSSLTSGSLNEIETSGLYSRKIINATCKWTITNFTLL